MSSAPPLPPAPIFQSPTWPHQNAAHSRNAAPATSASATAPAAAAPRPSPFSPVLSGRHPQTVPSRPPAGLDSTLGKKFPLPGLNQEKGDNWLEGVYPRLCVSVASKGVSLAVSLLLATLAESLV